MGGLITQRSVVQTPPPPATIRFNRLRVSGRANRLTIDSQSQQGAYRRTLFHFMQSPLLLPTHRTTTARRPSHSLLSSARRLPACTPEAWSAKRAVTNNHGEFSKRV